MDDSRSAEEARCETPVAIGNWKSAVLKEAAMVLTDSLCLGESWFDQFTE
jgi:hypothetical protein